MAIIEYEDKIKALVNKDNHEEFIYDFLSIYDKLSKATITKLRKGTNNLAKNPGEVYLKNKMYFKNTSKDVLGAFSQVETYVNEISSKPRYIIVTDYNRLLAKDTKTKDSLNIEFAQLPKYFEFFLAWNGIEKADFEKENPADIKAAEYFARIYDQLLEDNEGVSRHGFNLFLIRLLFCLFAEDTGIFKENSFTDFLKMMTSDDGADMNERISELFAFLDQKIRSGNEPSYLLEFPYVNGQLFTDKHEGIIFSKKTRKSIIDAGELIGWEKVNPDILGSMLQAVASENKRSNLGMHYTSVPNILKVINPLFLDGLRSDFESAKGNEHNLNVLYNKIGNIKLMDPACGSGNFLIIAYKELRQLEINIIKELNLMGIATMYVPSVTLDQFYGIEIDDFACDVTRLSLWIAEHQMNKRLEEEIDNAVRPTLPLQKAGAIVKGNALRINWSDVINYNKDDTVYLFGNPPYRGAKRQDENQKNDLKISLDENKKYKKLDYISGWFYKSAKLVSKGNVKASLITTNSITQGEQVSMIWPQIFNYSEIIFAYKSFKWGNNAKKNAGVSIEIIGLGSRDSKSEKKIYDGNNVSIVKSISPYIAEGNESVITSLNYNISHLPKMVFGSMPRDGGNLVLDEKEKDLLIGDGVDKDIIRPYVGAFEFLNDKNRYCLWMNENDYSKINSSLLINKVDKTRNFRRERKKTKSTFEASKTPWSFVQKGEYVAAYGYNINPRKISIIVPGVSSENRLYVPIGILESRCVISNSAMAIYDAPIWLFGILQSRMHMVWLRAVGGKLENRLRYSSSVVYNTFPIPEISKRRQNEIETAALNILDIRDEEGGSLSELYGSPLSKDNPKPMNNRLLVAHKKLDYIVEKIYKNNEFNNDNERLSLLLDMYNKKLEDEK